MLPSIKMSTNKHDSSNARMFVSIIFIYIMRTAMARWTMCSLFTMKKMHKVIIKADRRQIIFELKARRS